MTWALLILALLAVVGWAAHRMSVRADRERYAWAEIHREAEAHRAAVANEHLDDKRDRLRAAGGRKTRD